MVEATALPTPHQVAYRTAEHRGLADTRKDGVGGSAGPRPHELLEAALAACATITARIALAEAGWAGSPVSVRVDLDRGEDANRVRWTVELDRSLPADVRAAVLDRVERCPVRRTLSRPVAFDPLQGEPATA